MEFWPETSLKKCMAIRKHVTLDPDYRGKYRTVSQYLKETGAEGSLLDLGARDRILLEYLPAGKFQYLSADLGSGHDFELNLEQRLPFKDGAFDYVVALDVLEHLENIHQAFRELVRVMSRSAVIALPNLAVASKRQRFLETGRLGHGKYDLLPDHQGDRHRWVTVYPDMERFIAENAARCGVTVQAVFEEIEGGPEELRRSAAGLEPDGRFVDRCIYFVSRQ
jgi:SAM-dependent methyltransferase